MTVYNENDKNEAGRNCWKKTLLTASLESNLEKSLIQTEVVSAKIEQFECNVEKMVSKFGEQECVKSMQVEIIAEKEDHAQAEQEVNRYNAKIGNKLKENWGRARRLSLATHGIHF